MRSRGRTTYAVVLCVVALSAASCTGNGGNGTGDTPNPSGGPLTSNAPVTFKPGEFQYAFDNITATLSLQGSDGTLRIQNGSAGDVGAPALYVITGDDRRFDGTIAGAAPIPKGGDVTMQVVFPPQVTAKTAGLVVLLLGSNNMGALAPVAEGALASPTT